MTSAKRIAYATLSAFATAMVFIFIPLYLLPLVERYANLTSNSFGYLPYLGVAMTITAFFSSYVKHTRYEGAGVIAWSLASITYALYVFGLGSLLMNLTLSAQQTAKIAIEFTLLFFFIILVPILGVARGAIMLARHEERVQANTQPKKDNFVDENLPPYTD